MCVIRNLAVSMSQDHCSVIQNGEIRVMGLISEDAIAGRMEICYSGWWRAVCADDWDLRDAAVACRQMLNLPQSGKS